MNKYLTIVLLFSLMIVGCSRNKTSEKPPVHLVLNMDNQPKVKQQTESRFFADGLAMREPIEGTVARGQFHPDSAFFYEGKDARGGWVSRIPMEQTPELLARGQQRFGIYCVPCHGQLADGNSMMVKRKMPPPPSLHEQRLRDSLDGYFYSVVSDGKGNMPPYKYQISPEDRWAIITWLRELQRTQPVAPPRDTATVN